MSDLKKGSFRTFLYYLFTTVAIVLTHWIYGWEYHHAPPLSFFVFVLAMVIGVFWLLIDLLRLGSKKKNQKIIGSLIVHIVIITGCISFVAVFLN